MKDDVSDEWMLTEMNAPVVSCNIPTNGVGESWQLTIPGQYRQAKRYQYLQEAALPRLWSPVVSGSYLADSYGMQPLARNHGMQRKR